MARTATARAGKRKAAKEPPKPPPKKRAKRAKNGQGKEPAAQSTFLAEVKRECPGITSLQFVDKFKVPPDEVFRHRAFVYEYFRDFMPANAALRMGYPKETAATTGNLLFHHAFTQLLIAEMLDAASAETMTTGPKIIAGLLREANAPDVAFSSNSSTRISALKTLAQIYGLLGPKPRDKEPPTVSPGIMLVPFAVSPDDWESYALESQKGLRESVILDV